MPIRRRPKQSDFIIGRLTVDRYVIAVDNDLKGAFDSIDRDALISR